MGVSLAAAFPEQVFTHGCPTREVLDHVMSKWAPLVLAALGDGEPLRWSELRRRADRISEKMLAQTLRTLEADGIVHREVTGSVPPRVDYSLTGRGSELVARLLPLMEWIVDNADQIVARPSSPERPALPRS
jgi:DNA-binding HxlR family transcriptional regulator